MEEKVNVEELAKSGEALKYFMETPEFQHMYQKMHTPWKRRADKINRNDICPFCDSGKKFKNCECFEKYKNTPIYTVNYGKNN